MSSEEKIKELEERIIKLEAAENKRIRRKKIKIAFEVLKISILLFICIYGYIYINKNFIIPYKEKVDYVSEKIDSINNFIQDKWNIFKRN